MEDVHEGGGWKKKIIRSFGNAAIPQNVAEAEKFANAVNAGKYLHALGMTDDELRQTLKRAAGAAAGAAALTFVLSWFAKQKPR